MTEKYISKNYLDNLIEGYLDRFCGPEYFTCSLIQSDLEDAPVLEVRHGHWIEDRMNIVCSECGVEYSDEIIFMNRDFKYKSLNYCPNCGSQMDGDKNA